MNDLDMNFDLKIELHPKDLTYDEVRSIALMAIRDKQRAERECKRLRETLIYIAKWQLPQLRGSDGQLHSYAFERGSNGEREHIRKHARDALDFNGAKE